MNGLTEQEFEAVKSGLERGDRQTIIELLNNGLNLSPMIKSLAYVQLQQMTDFQINDLCSKALTALPMLRENRINDLVNLLTNYGVPGPIIQVIKTYGNRNND